MHASRANSASLIPHSLEGRPKQSPNMLNPPLSSRGGSRLSNYGARPVATPSSVASRSRRSSPPQTPHEGLQIDPKLEIKDLVKDAVKEYFDSLNLPQMLETHREATAAAAPAEYNPGYFDEEQVWAVVHKDPLSEIMNSTQPRPTSRQLSATGLQRSKTQYWKDESEFQSKLENWASTASQHEQEIVKNLLTKLKGGEATEIKAKPIKEGGKPKNSVRRSYSGAVGGGKKVVPAQYQCDLSMFTKPPYNPQRHFIINPEWTSERYTVKKIPAAHLHPSASLKNKLGLLRS